MIKTTYVILSVMAAITIIIAPSIAFAQQVPSINLPPINVHPTIIVDPLAKQVNACSDNCVSLKNQNDQNNQGASGQSGTQFSSPSMP
jgi:hypothetical protein